MNLPALRETKALYKDHEDAKIFGVCAGIGHRFGIDPTYIRAAFLLAFFGWGVGFGVYLVAAFALPQQPKQPKRALKPAPEPEVPQDLVDAWKEVNDITEN